MRFKAELEIIISDNSFNYKMHLSLSTYVQIKISVVILSANRKTKHSKNLRLNVVASQEFVT